MGNENKKKKRGDEYVDGCLFPACTYEVENKNKEKEDEDEDGVARALYADGRVGIGGMCVGWEGGKGDQQHSFFPFF